MIDEEVFKGRAFACLVKMRGYTCMYCNKGYELNDPEFDYWRTFSERNYLVRAGIARVGDPMNIIDVNTGRGANGGYDPKGWFARCVDRDACARRRRNIHNGVPAEHLSFLDEAENIAADLREMQKVMV